MTHPVFAFSDTLVDRIAHHRPAMATMWGMKEHDHAWDDISPEGLDAWSEFLAQAAAEIDQLPTASDPWDRLAVDVATDWVTHEQAELASGLPYRWLSHIGCPFQGYHLTLTHMDASPAGHAAIRARLHGLPASLEGYRRTLALGLDRGERASVRQVRSCIEQGRNVVHNRLLHLLPGDEAERATQAYADLTEWLVDHYLPRADPRDGVGEARYLPAAEGFLHDTLDLDATYAEGWQGVVELHTELQAVLARVAPGRTLAEVVQAWRSDPATSAPDADAFLAQIRAWQDDALASLADVLPVPEIARQLTIERSPLGLPPGAWYMMPSEDGKRPGKVQYSLPEGVVPLFDQQSTACHEGFPGHHLQLAIQTTLAGRLSRLHRLAFHCTGFAEGWALYAERLVDERGGYDDDVQRAGYLVNQIARACRVVLDIGLHTGRPMADVPLPTTSAAGADTGYEPGATFTYERGVAFLTEIGGLRPEVSASEITRYLGWPGQAISYSVGMRRMLSLRQEFLARGGDLRGFHDRVLHSGTVGLGKVAETVLG